MPVAPTQKVALTKQYISTMKCPPGKDRIYVFDSKTPALAVCRTRADATSWYLYKRVNGRPTRIRLGGWPELTVENARALCAKQNVAIANGIDVQAEKQTAREELTVSELFKKYLDQHAKVHKRTWEEDKRLFDGYCGAIKGKRLSTLSPMSVAALHARIGKDNGPYQANRVLAMLRSMFSRAHTWRLMGENPARGVTMFAEKSRERFLQPDEMPRFLAAVQAEENTVLRDFVLMCLWSGQRRSNVQAMRWAHVDLAQAIWRIPAEETKNGQQYNVPLIEPAMLILLERRKVKAASKSEYVFPGRRRGGHLEEPKGAWARILERAGIKDLRLHDLRRTAGSWMAAAGTSLPVIGKMLGHRSTAATMIYSRLNIDPARFAMAQASQAMLASAEPKALPVEAKKLGRRR